MSLAECAFVGFVYSVCEDAGEVVELRDFSFRGRIAGYASVVLYEAADLMMCEFYGQDGILVRDLGTCFLESRYLGATTVS